MTFRKKFNVFKNYPYVGLFHHPCLHTILRESKTTLLTNNLPTDNPYIGFFNHSVLLPPVIDITTTRTVSTQTDPVESMVIGEKVIQAYGNGYRVLLDESSKNAV